MHEIDRLSSITQRLLDYSKPADDKVLGIDVAQVIERLFHILEPWAGQQKVKLRAHLSSESPRVRATDASLSEILFNLLRNAVEATRSTPNALVTVETAVINHRYVVRVIDNGPGIEPAIRENIYRPFVTSRSSVPDLDCTLLRNEYDRSKAPSSANRLRRQVPFSNLPFTFECFQLTAST